MLPKAHHRKTHIPQSLPHDLAAMSHPDPQKPPGRKILSTRKTIGYKQPSKYASAQHIGVLPEDEAEGGNSNLQTKQRIEMIEE